VVHVVNISNIKKASSVTSRNVPLNLDTLSVIGVGVTLAVFLKVATWKKSLFAGLRNQYAPKT